MTTLKDVLFDLAKDIATAQQEADTELTDEEITEIIDTYLM